MSTARKISQAKYIEQEDLEQFANKKVIPEILRKEILTALSYYPMLKDTTITFAFKESFRKHFMQAQPVISTMFRRREEREYIILMNKYFEIEDERIFIDSMPVDVLVGWIGHELGHIVDYTHRGFFSLIKFGIGYLISKSFIIGAERVADTYAIHQGLAGHLIQTKNYILNHTHLPDRFKSKIRRLYMPPEEVMMLVEKAHK
ncbi:hypothetical protein C900_03351 [Fulvivirga imtechensis AK7]|uniref:Peptidase M48 domain-containing protein n=1 Tax=Fulvivirga imtechensis AK7 TaxID=1237149 RepID=L8JRF1_9BACT|nr:hypothetical protein [Fulvivirga imtechensis]ELR70743.1 hypothetical protein C900_03351 [Fulvivirga imtechensis AK7]